MDDVDTVFGGGIVPGSFVLIAGEPGVGKSTLLLELTRKADKSCIYFSGEESPSQVRLRADRMAVPTDRLHVSREMDLSVIRDRILADRPKIAFVDSVQTIYGSNGSTPGSVGQLREAASVLMDACKTSMSALIVTGHVTKDGAVAGPRLLEHMVDAVFYFENDRLNHHRILRAIKNRFGPVGELAIFEMQSGGLREIRDFRAAEPGREAAPGRIHSVVLEGSRAIVAEVQALVVRSSYGQARRMADGLDNRRLILISAVLEKYLRLKLAENDIFANLAGGLTSDDTALDLALAAAIVSSYRESTEEDFTAYIGEVGLTGEVRSVGGIERRIKELTNLGFNKIYIPAAAKLDPDFCKAELIPVKSVQDIVGTAEF